MDAGSEVVIRFLEWAIEKHALPRYRAVFGTQSWESTVIFALHDKLQIQLRSGVIVQNPPSSAQDMPCRLYRSNGVFGKRYESVLAALKEVNLEDAWLIVTEDSEYGLHRGEWSNALIHVSRSVR